MARAAMISANRASDGTGLLHDQVTSMMGGSLRLVRVTLQLPNGAAFPWASTALSKGGPFGVAFPSGMDSNAVPRPARRETIGSLVTPLVPVVGPSIPRQVSRAGGQVRTGLEVATSSTTSMMIRRLAMRAP